MQFKREAGQCEGRGMWSGTMHSAGLGAAAYQLRLLGCSKMTSYEAGFRTVVLEGQPCTDG